MSNSIQIVQMGEKETIKSNLAEQSIIEDNKTNAKTKKAIRLLTSNSKKTELKIFRTKKEIKESKTDKISCGTRKTGVNKTSVNAEEFSTAETAIVSLLSKKLSNKTHSSAETPAIEQNIVKHREEARGTNSDECISQTIHMHRKSIGMCTQAEIVICSKHNDHSPENKKPFPSANDLTKSSISYEDVGDQFVYLPSKLSSVNANFPLNKSKKLINAANVSQSSVQLNTIGSDYNKWDVRQLEEYKNKTEQFLLSQKNKTDDNTLPFVQNLIQGKNSLPKFPRGGTPSPVLIEKVKQPGNFSNKKTFDSSLQKKNSLPSTSKNKESSTSSKFTEKLSKSFFDLTQGSHDRLFKWKTKLQQQCRHQQSSSKTNLRAKNKNELTTQQNSKMYTVGGAIPATSEMNIIVDWTMADQNARADQSQSSTNSASSNSNLLWKRKSNAKILNSTKIKNLDSGAMSDGEYSFLNNGQTFLYSNFNTDGHYNQNLSVQSRPRLLHNSHSASNALIHTLMSVSPTEPLVLQEKHQRNSLAKDQKNQARSKKITNRPNIMNKSTLFCKELFSLDSAALPTVNNNGKVSVYDNKMEHRTLRQHHENNSNREYFIAKTLDCAKPKIQGGPTTFKSIDDSGKADKSNENYLPPPARIMPFSGIKPQDDAIIRPIAFRPMPHGGNMGQKALHRQSVGVELSSYYNDNSFLEKSPRKLLVTSNGSTTAIPSATTSITSEQHKQMFRDHSQSIGNLVSASGAPHKPSISLWPLNQVLNSGYSASSTHLYNTGLSNHHNASANRLNQHRSIDCPPSRSSEENDYDTVPENIGYSSKHQKCQNNASNFEKDNNAYSLISHYNNNDKFKINLKNDARDPDGFFPNSVSGLGNGANNPITTLRNASSSSGASSAASTTFKNSSSTKDKSTNIGMSDRRLSNLHITPSPSDSGIVDYETLIRDKENELSSVRHAMEQNEEVLIRVYQEKERQFKEQIVDLKQKLDNNLEADQALRQQLQESKDIRQQLQNSVKRLTDDRITQQKKCRQMEDEIVVLKLRCNNLEKFSTKVNNKCLKCSSTQFPSNNRMHNSFAGDSVYPQGQPPMPKETFTTSESSGNRKLRCEMDELRDQVSSLRDQLNIQFQFFNDERRKNDNEKTIARSASSPISSTSSEHNSGVKFEQKIKNKSALYTNKNPSLNSLEKRRGVMLSTDRLI